MAGAVMDIARRLARKAAGAAFCKVALSLVDGLEQGGAEAAAIIGRGVSCLAPGLEGKLGGSRRLFVFDSDDAERNRMIAAMPSCTYGPEAELLPYALSCSGINALDLVILRPDLWSMPLDLYSCVISGIRWSLRDGGILVVITASRRAAPALRECFCSVRAKVSFAYGFPVFTYACRVLEDQAGSLERILGS